MTFLIVYKRFLADECGATAIEYALIATLIAVGMIGGASAFTDSLNAMFTDVDGELSDAFDSDATPPTDR